MIRPRLRPHASASHTSGLDMPSTQSMDNPLSWFGDLESPSKTSDLLPIAGVNSPAFARLLRAFLATRALLGVALVGGTVASVLMDRSMNALATLLVSVYACLALAWWAWPQRSIRQSTTVPNRWLPLFSQGQQTLSAVVVDLLFFALFNQLQFGLSVNTTALLALPVLMASVLLRRFFAVATAAAATLLLLAMVVLEGWQGNSWNASLTTAGVSGIGFFAIALAVSELAIRLSKEQRNAQDHMGLARQQAQLNRLVIEEMTEGVLVIDRQGRVRSANPAARQLLSAHGQTGPAPFQLRGVPAWLPLVSAIEQAFVSPAEAMQPQQLLITFDDQTRRGLQMRLKFTQNRQHSEQDDVCVVLLEDLRQISARARQDKLAAMGRMSAGLAHEIRNPLAAISQANALLAEDAATPGQQRLTGMVADNVQRLKQIVDDILAVSPGSKGQSPLIDIRHATREAVDQWLSLHQSVSASQRLKVDLLGLPPAELNARAMVRFDPEHLRRILINLLDNAARHSSQAPQAMMVSAQCLGQAPGAVQIMVSVLSDGPPIEPSVEAALFEPFFSTRSQGTGLGLYICRELCEQHGASMEYRSHPPTKRHRNEFYLLMPMAELATEPS
jgi:two-component system, NtrC family, sensor histidine kinase PilS